MENEKKQVQVKEFISKIDNKDFGLYFFTLDTKGNPTAGIANIYEHVKVLNDLGYKAHILHEKDDYHGVEEWLGEEYAKLPHVSIEQQNLKLVTIDYIIVPEIFANVMEQVKDFPCKKIVFSQSYSYILEFLPIGNRWDLNFGFTDVITTSERQSEYIKDLFPSIDTHIIPPSIPEYFKTTDKIKKPIVSIVTRDQKTALRLVKSFYLQHPMYKWITFRELRGLPRKTFAEQLGESCLAIWVDDESSFGTFPIEAMECDTPVIGKIPAMIPEWMEDDSSDEQQISLKDNGVWTNNELSIPNLVSEFMRVWLEDNVPNTLMEGVKKSKGQYTEDKQVENIKRVYGNLIANRRSEFEALIDITKEKEKENKDEK
jgi:hypothetical protein